MQREGVLKKDFNAVAMKCLVDTINDGHGKYEIHPTHVLVRRVAMKKKKRGGRKGC